MYGGTVVVLDVEHGSALGIDGSRWDVTAKFRGVKMLPPGVHALHYGPSPGRVLLLLQIHPGEVLALRYDADAALVVPLDAMRAAQVTAQVRRGELDAQLAVYDADGQRDWPLLLSHVDDAWLKTWGCMLGAGESSMSSGLDACRLLLPPQAISAELAPADVCTDAAARSRWVTAANMDATLAVDAVLASADPSADASTVTWAAVLGHIQAAFLFFLLAESLTGWECWKAWIDLLCRCRRAVHTRPTFFLRLLDTLERQLTEAPKDFFTGDLSRDNFLSHRLAMLMATIADRDEADAVAAEPGMPAHLGEDQATLRARALALQSRLLLRFQWDVSSSSSSHGSATVADMADDDGDASDDDEGPVVVDLDEPWLM